MRNVWLINRRTHDHAPAESFGRLRTITEGVVNIFAVDRNLAALQQELATSDPDDYLLFCGSISLNVLASFVMMNLHGRVNMLLYDLKQRRYTVRTIRREEVWTLNQAARGSKS